jgi:hypothetical protein
VIVHKRRTPLVPVASAAFGSMPNNDGNLILDEAEAGALRSSDPIDAKYIRPLVSSRQVLYGEERYCLWLRDADPADFSRAKGA